LIKTLPFELVSKAKEIAIRENPANKSRPRTPFELAADVTYFWKPGTTIIVRFLEGMLGPIRK